jgi:hypothetical protein
MKRETAGGRRVQSGRELTHDRTSTQSAPYVQSPLIIGALLRAWLMRGQVGRDVSCLNAQ